MVIKLKSHLGVILFGIIFGAILYGRLGQMQVESLLELGFSEANVQSITWQFYVLGAVLIGGIMNGCYLVYQFFAARKNLYAKTIGLLICIFAFPLCGFFGVILLVPAVLLNLYQAVFNRRFAYVLSLDSNPIIQDVEMPFAHVEDSSSRELLISIEKKINTRKTILILIFLMVLVLLFSHLSILSFIFLFVASCILIASFSIYQNKLLAPVNELLITKCDPYRVTMIMDALLEAKLVNPYRGNELLLRSLQVQDNRSRIRTILNTYKTLGKSGNFRKIMDFSAMSNEEKEACQLSFLKDNQNELLQMKKRKRNHFYDKLIDNFILLNEADILFAQKNYAEVFNKYTEITSESQLAKIQKILKEAKCCIQLGMEEEAEKKLKYVMENGNTTCYVQIAREVLEEIQKKENNVK